MKWLNRIFFCALLQQLIVFDAHAQSEFVAKSDHKHERPIAVSSFEALSPAVPYEIVTQAFPNFVSLSANRNSGFKDGNITLTSGGIKIRKTGIYSINFNVLLVNNDSISPTPSIPLFLARNDVVDIINPSDMCSTNIFAFGPVPFGAPVQLQGSGIVKVKKRNTTFTIFATNAAGGSVPITVAAWSITAFRINDKVDES